MLQCDHRGVGKQKEDTMELIVLSGIAAVAVVTIELLDYAR
jgi:hypothetical protein